MISDRKYIDLAAIPNDALARFRKLAVTAVMDSSPVFGAWLRSWCETEELYRKKDPANRPTKHAVGLPPAHTWNDRELGQALRAATALSYMPLHGSFSDVVDRIVLVISEEASTRLESHA